MTTTHTTITLPLLSFSQLDELAARVPHTLRVFQTLEGTELRATVKTEDAARLLALVHRFAGGA